MNKKIVLAGGTGFLGSSLIERLHQRGMEIVLLTRKPSKYAGPAFAVGWDGVNRGDWVRELEDAAAVINLCGKSVNCRYHIRNKAEILRSRIKSTQAIGNAIASLEKPPALWINASTATIYRHSLDTPMSESGGELGTGFSVSVARAWEHAFFLRRLPNTRRLALRTSLALGWDRNSAYPTLALLARFGFGGQLGDGKQMFSWIHVDDFVRAVEFAIEDESLSGVLNVTAPAPVTNRVFMRELRKSVGRPFGLPTPKPVLNAGARLLRTEAELVLKSRYAIPEKLLSRRFVFNFPFIDEALRDLNERRCTRTQRTKARSRSEAGCYAPGSLRG